MTMHASPTSAAACSTGADSWSAKSWEHLLAEFQPTSVQSTASADAGFTIATVGSRMRIDGRWRPVVGSGCAREADDALTSATGEFVEHVLTWLCGLHRAVDPGLRRHADGTGLAVHRDVDRAVLHASQEYVERQLLDELWYGEGFHMEMVAHDSGLRVLATRAHGLVFAVCEVRTHPQGYALGSCVRGDLSAAVSHAHAEGVMLADSLDAGRVHRNRAWEEGLTSEGRTRLNAERAEHLTDRSACGSPSPIAEPATAVLAAGSDWALVQAGSVPGRPHVRTRHAGVVPDPFC